MKIFRYRPAFGKQNSKNIILKVKRISTGDFCYRLMWRLFPRSIIWPGKIVKICPSQFPEAKGYVFQIVNLNTPNQKNHKKTSNCVMVSFLSLDRFGGFMWEISLLLFFHLLFWPVCGETRWHRSGFSNVRIRIWWQFVCLVTTERIKLHPPSPDEADYQSFWVLNLFIIPKDD